MPKNKRRKSAEIVADPVGIIVKTLVGSLTSLLIFFLLALIFSAICLKLDIDSAYYKYPLFVASAISGFMGGLVAVKRIRKKGWIIGAASAAPAFSVIFLICSIISRTGISSVGWISAAVMTLCASIGGILSVGKR